MKLAHLREFSELARTLNFSTAARQLGISQPMLSAHIKSMEDELGFLLFNRDKHSVSLTDIGKIFLPEAESAVEHYERALDACRREMERLSVSLRVGYLYNAFRSVMPIVSREFSNRYPEMSFQMHSYGYKDTTDALLSDDVDVILTIDVDRNLHGFCECEKLGEDELCCVVRSDDPLAERQALFLEELRDEPFILPRIEESGAYACYIRDLFAKSGFRPNPAVLYREIDTRYLSIEAGEGVSLVGRHFQPYMSSDFKFIPLENGECKYDLAAFWKKGTSNKNIRAFVDLVKEHQAAIGGRTK